MVQEPLLEPIAILAAVAELVRPVEAAHRGPGFIGKHRHVTRLGESLTVDVPRGG